MVQNEIYIVSWLDHFSDSRWMSEEELREFLDSNLGTCTNVGYKSYEDDNWVIISGSYDGDGGYGENIAIHKKVIVSMTELTE